MDTRAINGYIGAILDTKSSIQIVAPVTRPNNYRPRITLSVKNKDVFDLVTAVLKENSISYSVLFKTRKRIVTYTTHSVVITKKACLNKFLKLMKSYHLVKNKTDLLQQFLNAGNDQTKRENIYNELKALNLGDEQSI